MKRSGVTKHIVPHELRHTCFTWLAEDGEDIYKIMRLAGHSSIRTTQVYFHRNSRVDPSTANRMARMLQR